MNTQKRSALIIIQTSTQYFNLSHAICQKYIIKVQLHQYNTSCNVRYSHWRQNQLPTPLKPPNCVRFGRIIPLSLRPRPIPLPPRYASQKPITDMIKSLYHWNIAKNVLCLVSTIQTKKIIWIKTTSPCQGFLFQSPLKLTSEDSLERSFHKIANGIITSKKTALNTVWLSNHKGISGSINKIT